MAKGYCEWCSDFFSGRKKLYCSPECRAESDYMTASRKLGFGGHARKCQYCGAGYTGRSDKKYCSIRCGQYAAAKRYQRKKAEVVKEKLKEPVPCRKCGEGFVRDTLNRAYCDKCKTKSYKLEKKEPSICECGVKLADARRKTCDDCKVKKKKAQKARWRKRYREKGRKAPSKLSKVAKRALKNGKGCSNCGWNEDQCDIHHINGRDVDNPHGWWNLTILCPNCHRLEHKGKLDKVITLEEWLPINDPEYWENWAWKVHE